MSIEGPISDKPKFTYFVQWGFYTALMVLGMIIASFIGEMKNEVVKVRDEMGSLNNKVATILVQGDYFGKELDRVRIEILNYGDRIRALEIKQKQ
jgi:hypothetical protein